MSQSLPAVLLLDDEIRSVESMARILSEEFDVFIATQAEQALSILQEQHIHVILADQRMPNMSGVEFLIQVRQRYPDIVRMIISGYTDPEDIIEGINFAGIYQYIPKPWHPDSLLLTVRNAARLFQLQRDNEILSLELKLSEQHLLERTQHQRKRLKSSFHLDNIIRAADSGLNQALALVERVAPYDISVLISGESGTGKELFARAVHYNSARADKPFIVENCGALPDTLLESELFGHKRGAFTGAIADHIGLFEQAHNGTLFLDEIGETSSAFQVKLLRVLQDGSFRPVGSNQRRYANVRIIAATNRNLLEMVRAGRFREDLYYRLAGLVIELPPLRTRQMDIEPLLYYLLKRTCQQLQKPMPTIEATLLQCLQAYTWPGNVRELQNEIQRLVVLNSKAVLSAEFLSPAIQQTLQLMQPLLTTQAILNENTTSDLKVTIELLESQMVQAALQKHKGNKSRAAEELGLSRVGLRNKLERYGLENN
jgi:two-component system response regulator HupR/HoxA